LHAVPLRLLPRPHDQQRGRGELVGSRPQPQLLVLDNPEGSYGRRHGPLQDRNTEGGMTGAAATKARRRPFSSEGEALDRRFHRTTGNFRSTDSYLYEEASCSATD